jgi:hypothetical protein
MVTRVPSWPRSGLTEKMVPAAMYAKPPTSETVPPVLDVRTTSPVNAPTDVGCPARTTTSVVVLDSIVATTPARVTWLTAEPPPNKREPDTVTSVLSTPELGVTASITPAGT